MAFLLFCCTAIGNMLFVTIQAPCIRMTYDVNGTRRHMAKELKLEIRARRPWAELERESGRHVVELNRCCCCVYTNVFDPSSLHFRMRNVLLVLLFSLVYIYVCMCVYVWYVVFAAVASHLADTLINLYPSSYKTWGIYSSASGISWVFVCALHCEPGNTYQMIESADLECGSDGMNVSSMVAWNIGIESIAKAAVRLVGKADA